MAGIKSSRLQFLFSLLFFQLFINSVQFPLSDCTIRGKITDSLTQRPLVQATIKIAGTTYGAISDTNGIYSIENIPRGIYSISVSLIGYKSIVRDNIRISGQITVENFSLYEIPTLISGVTIRPDNDRSELNEFTGSLRLDNSRLKRIPGNLEDVVRSVTILPGVSQLTNYYNDLVVKGGGPAENLFIIDGLEVANLNHFGSQVNSGGVNSFINMDYVKSVDFSAGGFSSLYGDKISSVTEISLRNGNSDHLSGSAVLSATQFALNLEGP
ncbi:MAG: carboxypeptidase-like regulatory domain-containing protein, partial [Bacillota bacterium]